MVLGKRALSDCQLVSGKEPQVITVGGTSLCTASFPRSGGRKLALPLASVWFLGGPFPCPPPKKSQRQVGTGALERARPRSLEGGAGGEED